MSNNLWEEEEILKRKLEENRKIFQSSADNDQNNLNCDVIGDSWIIFGGNLFHLSKLGVKLCCER